MTPIRSKGLNGAAQGPVWVTTTQYCPLEKPETLSPPPNKTAQLRWQDKYEDLNINEILK